MNIFLKFSFVNVRSLRLCARYSFLAVASLLLSFLFLSPAPSQATEVYGQSARELGLYEGSELLQEWRVREARELVDRLLAKSPKDPMGLMLKAKVLFFESRYDESLELIDRLGWKNPFRDLVAVTARENKGAHSRTSEHFILTWKDPKDEVLVQPALETLEAARAALLKHLGFAPEERVRVEIYPSVGSFTAVSTLTREEVRTSGTIGLCKFNRLMIASPRATAFGYSWRDTLSHEYLHLLIYRLSRSRAPIWLHEGIAKYLEGAWRGSVGELPPSSEALLARRLKEGTLITLDQMSPSVAKLKSAEDTELAFAEASTMIRFLVEKSGPEAILKSLKGMADGRNDREAVAAVWGGSFESFENEWRDWARGIPLRTETVQVIATALADEGSASEDSSDIPNKEANDFVRLGDLLRDRGRADAAAEEYAKAYGIAPTLAGVASRHIWGRMAVKDLSSGLAAAESALRYYPDFSVFWSRKGDCLFGLGRYAEAAEAYRQLMNLNPFHVPGRTGLLMASRKLNDQEEIKRQEWALKLVGSDHPHGGHP